MRAIFLTAIVSCLFAQQPAIETTTENAKLQTRAFSGTLAGQLSGLGAGPFWAGWSEPAIAGHHSNDCSGDRDSSAPLRLEGDTAFVILVRVENHQPGELRVASPDCRLDAGGLPFYWFSGVPASESLAWLKSQASGSHGESAIMAISLHRDAEADRALDDLTGLTEPVEVRKRAAFWLGNSRGAQGIATLRQMLAKDPDSDVRNRVIFALAHSKDPQGIPLVIEAARSDKDAHIREQALFWLAQKAAAQVSKQAIQNAVANNPDAGVRERAVFALTQMPNGGGVPLLIDLATNSRDPAVRKKAAFWLGQSKDPRALDFLARVLRP